MMQTRNWMFALFFFIPTVLLASGEESFSLKKAKINLHDRASLQRGAALFMNYCAGCHSLQYARYNLVAKDIGIVNAAGEVDQELLKKSLVFTGVKVGENIRSALSVEQGKKWFGVPPPDLTLEARYRGPHWIYTYLNSFYKDNTRPLGSNNLLIPNVAMPNVLEALQGDVYPVVKGKLVFRGEDLQASHPIEDLEWIQNGKMFPREFEAMTNDIVNFLSYVAEPAKLHRYYIGVFVLLFVVVFLVIAYLLKKEFWKDVK